jgi:hypothetical protein
MMFAAETRRTAPSTTPRRPGVLRNALHSGSVASIVSTVVLAYFGRQQRRSALAPVNAPSHWLWREESIRAREFTLRHTVTGYLVHHGSSVFWAALFERLLRDHPLDRPHRLPHCAATAMTVAALAAGVDLKLTPQRFTPGFERHLSGGALAVMYGAFGVALFAAYALRKRVTELERPPAPNPPGPAHPRR